MTWNGRSREGIERQQEISKYTIIKRSSNFSIKAQEDGQHAIEEH